MAMQSDHEFAPTRIARAVFPTAFRGYDQDAVRRYLSRLAAALEHQQEYAGLGELEARTPAHERVEELEAELEDLRSEIRDLELELVQRSVDGDSPEAAGDGGDASAAAKPAPEPAFDEHRAIELLGQETARVLESARSAAADILKRAETQAASLKAQAKSELAEAQRRAEALVTDKRAEAEELATRLVTDAEVTAERLTTTATTEAEQATSEAKAEAAKVRSEAKAAAEQATTEAAAEAERVTTEATAEAEALTAEAEASAERVTAEAESHRDAVVEESTRMLAEAEERAESDLAEADARAKQIVADAETLRQQVIAELVGERREAQVEMDRMTSARDRLAMSLAVARSELDEVADALVDVSTIDLRVDTGRPKSPAALALDAAVGDSPADSPQDEADDAEPPTATADPAPASDPKRSDSKGGDSKGSDPKRSDGKGGDGKGAASKRSGGKRGTAKKARGRKRPTTATAEQATATGASATATLEQPAPKASEPVEAGEAVEPEPVVVESVDPPSLQIEADEIDLQDETLNPVPAEGEELSLVEGFTTIDLDDEVVQAAVESQPIAEDALVGELGADANPEVQYSVVVNEPETPEDIITTVAARTGTAKPDRMRGDIALDRAYTGRLPDAFAARDAAVARSMPSFRRQLRRALNDDQSELLELLRSGRGDISIDEIPPAEEQVGRFLNPLRRGLAEVAQAGAAAGGQGDLPPTAIDNLVRGLAGYIVERVRTPTIEVVAQTTHHDRERILEPIRALYREFRNGALPDLAEDAVYEAFAIGVYHSIEPAAPVRWNVDPRTDPDPVCEINRDRSEVVKGEMFPSGHVRPLSLPGCRCLVLMVDL
jgi:DivIVA domain-containing protein